MKIITIKGSENSGKTTTLNIVIDVLEKLAEQYVIEKMWGGIQERDRRARFQLNSNETVCVCTPGDDEKILEANLEYAKENNATILVLAVRTELFSTLERMLEELNIEERIQKNLDKRNQLSQCSKIAIEILKELV